MPFISANICLTSLKPQLLFARSLVIAKHAKLMGRDRVALGRIFFGEEVTHGIDEAMCYGRREGDVFVARKMRVHRCRIRTTSPATRCSGSASCPCSSWVPACWGEAPCC